MYVRQGRGTGVPKEQTGCGGRADPRGSEVSFITRQQFMAELSKLLTFMYDEDRQRALKMYERMFDETADEQGLQQLLVSEQLPDADLHLFTDLDLAVLMLLNGDFDCIAVSEGNAEAIIATHDNVARSGFIFELDERHMGNVILLNKDNDELTEQVNQILQKASEYYDQWYEEAKSTAGIQVTYDSEGNVVSQSDKN